MTSLLYHLTNLICQVRTLVCHFTLNIYHLRKRVCHSTHLTYNLYLVRPTTGIVGPRRDEAVAGYVSNVANMRYIFPHLLDSYLGLATRTVQDYVQKMRSGAADVSASTVVLVSVTAMNNFHFITYCNLGWLSIFASDTSSLRFCRERIARA